MYEIIFNENEENEKRKNIKNKNNLNYVLRLSNWSRVSKDKVFGVQIGTYNWWFIILIYWITKIIYNFFLVEK